MVYTVYVKYAGDKRFQRVAIFNGSSMSAQADSLALRESRRADSTAVKVVLFDGFCSETLQYK